MNAHVGSTLNRTHLTRLALLNTQLQGVTLVLKKKALLSVFPLVRAWGRLVSFEEDLGALISTVSGNGNRRLFRK